MTAAGLNVCAGIDAGSSCSKLAYSDSLGTRIIASADGGDFLALREEAEIFFDEPVFSCVIAVNDDAPSHLRGKIMDDAVSSGFTNTKIIPVSEALCLGLRDEARTLVCDFGAAGCRMTVVEAGKVMDAETVEVGGDMFDRDFAGYLRQRRMMENVSPEILREARRLKHILSRDESRLWHNMEIHREDFTRLAYFPVKRAGHTARRMLRVWKPGRFVLTGGCAEIPVVREVFRGAEVIDGLAVKGASLKALALTKQEARKSIADSVSRMREIRAELLSVEEGLTRQQKDRLYVLFRQAEGMNDPGITALMESLIREIRNA